MIIEEAKRLLKSQAKLLVIDWLKTATPFGPSVEKRIDPLKVKETANKIGLNLIEEFQAGPYHFGLIFQK